MINLPKPSQLLIKGTPDEKITYLINYITKLVTALEQSLCGVKSNNSSDSVAVKDVSLAGNRLIVIFTDGSEKNINL
nr:MAG TPA: hypothetical protein [Caudoviricetes sp.]